MSTGERIGIAIGIVGVILMGVQVWDILDRRGAMNIAIAIFVWVISILAVGYSIYRNVHDAHRAASLRAEIVTIKDEYATQASILTQDIKLRLIGLLSKSMRVTANIRFLRSFGSVS